VNGFIRPTGRLLGGHAFLVLAVNITKEFVTMKNSWGSEWGDNGRANIRFDDLQLLLKECGEACLGIESKPKLEIP